MATAAKHGGTIPDARCSAASGTHAEARLREIGHAGFECPDAGLSGGRGIFDVPQFRRPFPRRPMRRRKSSRAGAAPRWSNAICGPRPARPDCSGLSTSTAYGGIGGDFRHEAILIEERGQARHRRLGRIAAQRHRRALHPELRHRRAEAALAAALATRRAVRRHRHDRARRRLRPAGRARPRAKRDGNHYVINGSKTFITNGQTANLSRRRQDRPDAGRQGHLADRRRDRRGGRLSSAAATSTRSGCRRSDTSELFFDDVRVPTANLLGAEEGQGFFQLMEQLPQERLIIAVARRSAMIERALDVDHRLRQGAQGLRQAVDRLPEHPVQARRVQDRGDGRAGLRQPLHRAAPGRQARRRDRLDGEVLGHRPAVQDRRRVPAAARRLRLHGRIPDRPDVHATPACSASTAAPTRS